MISPDCHKDLPQFEHSPISSIVEICHKDLPSLQVRNHRAATKIIICFVQEYACFARLADTCGKSFVTKWQNLMAENCQSQQNSVCFPWESFLCAHLWHLEC